MPDTKFMDTVSEYLDYAGLSQYTELMKNRMDTADAESLKGVGFSSDGKSILFYKELPIEGATPAYTLELPETDTSDLMKLVTSAVATNIAIFDSYGQVVDSGTSLSDLATMAYVGTIPEGYGAKTIAEYAKELADNVAANGYDDTGLKSEIANLEVKVADVENAVSEKADKGTSLSDYGIDDAYTKAETNEAITIAVANADHLKREIVTTLPDVGDADTNTIYMVLKENGSGDQQYDEYMLINGAFEKIGDTAVDLTGYAKTEDVESAKNEAINTATTLVSELASGAVAANTAASTENSANITDLQNRVSSLESETFTAITSEEISVLFN